MRGKLRQQIAIAASVLLVLTISLHAAPTAAQTGASLPPNVGTGDCDRACLQGLAEQFIAAVIAHDVSKVPLAKGARYSENSVPLPIPDGFWKNATGVRPYRLYIADPEWGTIGFYARMYENGAPVIVSTRLRVYGHQLTEIETIVTSERSRLAPAGNTAAQTDYLGDKPRLFSSHCQRLEDGRPTSNVPVPPGQERGGINMSCAEDLATGHHRNDNRIRSRRIMAVDVEHQIVMTSVYFDHENDAQIHTYQLKNGKTVTVNETSPSTLQAHETFSIDREGISQVEAVFTNVTYGTRPYFSTGFHMDSPQAVKDGFDEYAR
jgi:hypothetical protein